MMIKKGITDLSEFDFQAGQLLMVDKPAGWTSFRVVHKIRKASGVKKVGHAGTLDPLATGLLIVATGRKTKEITDYQAREKSYSGTITLGKSSPSMDLETEPNEFFPFADITEAEILKTKEKFTGKIFQVPPMFSAIKLGGKTMYNLARRGKTLELAPREIEITEFNITGINLPDVHFEITCSKGTYIRCIANDLGKELGCGGILSSLRRTKIGEFSIEEAFKIDELLELFAAREVEPV